METIQLAFYKGRDPLFNRLVSWWTKGPYSHCELIAGFNDDGSASCWSSSFLDGGVREKYIVLNPSKWDVVSISLPEGSLETALKWFQEHRGEPYDLLGLAGFIWGAVKDGKSKWFCSEAVAQALYFEESWRFCPNTLNVVIKRMAKENV